MFTKAISSQIFDEFGNVRCDKLPFFRAPGNKEHPKLPGFININVSTSNRGIYRNLSPMILGPFEVMEGSKHIGTATNFENYWQGSKIYNIDSGDSFFIRRDKMFADPQPHRRALPKKSGYPIASYLNGERLGYIESRKYYVNGYRSLVVKIPAYRDLQEKLNQGVKLHIIGYDGYDIGIITKKSIRAAYLDPSRPFGHELVLCGMLTNTLPEDLLV